MPEQKTDIANEVNNPAKAVVFFHAGNSGKASEDSLERLLSLGMPVFSHADYPGCSKTENNYAQIGLLLKELEATNSGCAVLLISADLDLENKTVIEIAEAIVEEKNVIARTVLTNATPGLNPFAGLSGNQKAAIAQIGGIAGIFGTG